MAFADRSDAGRQLAALLMPYKTEDPVVLALPRGGVPVAAEVAHALECPLDLLLVRKIGAPFQPELAMGAVVDGHDPVTVRNEDVIGGAGISEEAFAAARDTELAEIARRHRDYLGGRLPIPIKGRTAIVVDDGIATGATTRAALKALRQQGPKTLVLAVPVGPTDTLEALSADVDDLVAVERHEHFGAIGYFYRDFHQLTDADVIAILKEFPAK
jgi:predicted phosphoribosyltransferase